MLLLKDLIQDLEQGNQVEEVIKKKLEEKAVSTSRDFPWFTPGMSIPLSATEVQLLQQQQMLPLGLFGELEALRRGGI